MSKRNGSIPADGLPEDYIQEQKEGELTRSEPLSMAGTIKGSIATRKIAILAVEGVDAKSLSKIKDSLVAKVL